MGISRRRFLKIAGLSTLFGLGGKAALEVLAPGELEASLGSVPLSAGKRWALVVDTRKLTEETMKECIAACHLTHNVPDIGNTKEEIKWIWKEKYKNAFPDDEHEHLREDLEHKPLLVLCNHCAKPPCVRVCPTKATFQREDGIIMMDYHRCIGCRFCMAACPYGSRSFNWGDPRTYVKKQNLEFPTRTKGVVEKCNFCDERVSKGQYPACVEASKGALIFGDLGKSFSEIRKLLKHNYAIRRKPGLGTQPNVYYIV
jgi:molybdopterin-containing oxidoreductase family iron-sulfur binding subunit